MKEGKMPEFPFRSMREWLDFLDSKGELIHNKEEVDLTGDVSAISYKACRTGEGAIIHENIQGYPGWRIASNTLLGRRRQAWVLNAEQRNILPEIAPKIDARIPPMEVSTGPCKELKFFGDEVDLTKIPIPFTGELEGTPNITAGVSNIRDPETGWQNIAVRRFGLKGKNRLSEFINMSNQDYSIWSKYRTQGKKCPIAIILSPDPIVYVVSQLRVPIGVCEYDIWGAITGMPLEVVKCETSDLLVPATAEVVIEGEIEPFDREIDGPFPELFGYYTTLASVARVNVHAITMRKDPIYYYMNMGVPPTEGHDMGGLMSSISIYRALSKAFPGILDVQPHRMGILCIIKVNKYIAKSWPNYAAQIGAWLKGAGLLQKGVIIVDQDVEDLSDWNQVFDEVLAKFQASKDLTIIPRMIGTSLNPSEPWAGRWGWDDYFIIDCTEKPAPWDEGYMRGRALPPDEALKKVEENWERYGFKKSS